MNEPNHSIEVYWFNGFIYPVGHCISACMYYNTVRITDGVLSSL